MLLAGGLEHDFCDFPYIYIYIGNVIIPTDELVLFRGVETTNQKRTMRGIAIRGQCVV